VTASNSGLLPNPREPLHVGMLVASDYASDGRVRRQAEALVERGDEVTVLALKAQGREDIEMIEGVRVVHLPVSKYRGDSSGAYLKLYGSFALHSGLRLARRPRRFDLVQAHSMPEALVFCAAVQRAMRLPVVLDVHDLTSELFSSKFEGRTALMRAIRFSERASFRFSSEVLTVHESYADMLRGMTRTRVTTVMNCPDDKMFRPRVFREWSTTGADGHSASSRAENVVFGYHGLIAPRHGLVQVVEALAKVRADAPGAQLRLWGSGDGIDQVRERVDALGLGDAVRLPDGLVPIDRMTAELDQVHIGVLASQLDPWTRHVLPNKLMEYAVMGIPVITFRNPVIERYFPDDAVTYVDPASPENLHKAMLTLIKDPARARAQVAAAQKVMAGRTWRHQREHYYDVIDRMVARRRGRSD